VKLILRIAAIALLLTACGTATTGGSQAAGKVKGTVQSGPSCPVGGMSACPSQGPTPVRIDFKPVAGGNGQSTQTDSTGAYSIDLPPGTYRVSLNPQGSVVKGPQEVTVASGQVVTADYTLDSGMR
jgi:hypothetical protein